MDLLVDLSSIDPSMLDVIISVKELSKFSLGLEPKASDFGDVEVGEAIYDGYY